MSKTENNIAISVRNVRKTFKIFYDKGTSLKERLLFRNRRRFENREVLKDISFEVIKGEAIGFIGHNGCGKSTLLKLLTRIMYPDTGTINIKGRVSSLIELGAGFHPDMSGRENIYTNAAIFGLTRKEIDARLQDIIDFSELEDFIDNPVRTYSSGMYMRLAFSVAINVNADILLIDEILAVGDVAFQAKCFNKLREIKARGTTIIIVSHSLGQIEQICDRSIWIHEGLIRMEGYPKDVDMEYLDYMAGLSVENERKNREKETQQELVIEKELLQSDDMVENADYRRWGNGNARITHIVPTDMDNNEKHTFITGEDIVFVLDYAVKNTIYDAVFGIGIFNRVGIQCYGTNTRIDRIPKFNLEKNGRLLITLKNVNLLPGEYLIDFAIETENGIPVDYYREAVIINMVSPIVDVGVVRIKHEWDIKF